jgi:cytidyltransferase-like protein
MTGKKKPVNRNVARHYQKSVLIFGAFDRVHFGHVNFIEQAEKYGRVTCVVARDTTAAAVKNRSTKNTQTQRLTMLRALFPEVTFVLGHKTDRLAVVKRVQPEIICLGYDQVAFVDILKKFLKETKSVAKIVRLKPFSVHTHKSSFLKKNLMLVRGVVIDGLKEGRKIGYPTANIRMSSQAATYISHVRGVFAGRAYLRAKEYKAAIVIGMRMRGENPLVEAYLIGFKGSCYGAHLSLIVDKKIRNLKHFSSKDLLKERIVKDVSVILNS